MCPTRSLRYEYIALALALVLIVPLLAACSNGENPTAANPLPVLTATPTPTAMTTTITLTPTLTPTPALTSASAITATPTLTSTSTPHETLKLLSCWWVPTWSEDGTSLNISYTRGRGTLSEDIHVGKSYDQFGIQVEGNEVTERKGEDIYGREQNMTIAIPSAHYGGSVKPESVVASGTITYPAAAGIAQSWFARTIKVTVSYQYDNGVLKGGSGNEEFSGHISASAGDITYSGGATANFTVKDGQLLWAERVEKTSYFFKDRLYAETVTSVTPLAEYLGGRWITTSETYKTATTYADGSRRESEIVILSQHNEGGVSTGKSGSGVVTGTEVINGKSVEYNGSITISYGFIPQRWGWIKVSYSEKRSAETKLPERLPFEVISIDDDALRPVF
jgi:hypothetical protein